MNSPSLSICMIVKNEEKHLAKCLESVKPFVQEMIVVDTGSTDSTVEIARSFGAKVYPFEWIHDFAAARNESLAHATSEYILVLDADEYLEKNTSLVKELKLRKDYYILPIKNYKSDGRTFTHQAIRLFRRGLKYHGKLHEHLNIERSMTSMESSVVIHHVGYLDETVEEKNKGTRNLEIMRREVEVNPSPYALFNMGKTLMHNRMFEEGLDYLRRSYEANNRMTHVPTLLCFMLEGLRVLKRYEEAIGWADVAIGRHPDLTDFYFEKARIYEEWGYLKDAELLYKLCLDKGDAKKGSYSKEGVGSYLSRYHLARIYDRMRDANEALTQSHIAIEDNRHFRPALALYIRLLQMAQLTPEEMHEHLRQVYPIRNVDDMKTLFAVLYQQRHPVMSLVIGNLNRNDWSTDNLAVILQYNKQYEDAATEWKKLQRIPDDNIPDAVVLAFLLQDNSLLRSCREGKGLEQEEWDAIERALFQGERPPLPYSASLEGLLLSLCDRLILLMEFDGFELISGYLLGGSTDSQYRLAENLYQYGYSDPATDILYGHWEQKTADSKMMIMLGDLCRGKELLEEAAILYGQAAEQEPNYEAYLKKLHVLDLLQDHEEANRLKAKMGTAFPYSLWAAQWKQVGNDET